MLENCFLPYMVVSLAYLMNASKKLYESQFVGKCTASCFGNRVRLGLGMDRTKRPLK
jgi:hypothetical protein